MTTTTMMWCSSVKHFPSHGPDPVTEAIPCLIQNVPATVPIGTRRRKNPKAGTVHRGRRRNRKRNLAPDHNPDRGRNDPAHGTRGAEKVPVVKPVAIARDHAATVATEATAPVTTLVSIVPSERKNLNVLPVVARYHDCAHGPVRLTGAPPDRDHAPKANDRENGKHRLRENSNGGVVRAAGPGGTAIAMGNITPDTGASRGGRMPVSAVATSTMNGIHRQGQDTGNASMDAGIAVTLSSRIGKWVELTQNDLVCKIRK